MSDEAMLKDARFAKVDRALDDGQWALCEEARAELAAIWSELTSLRTPLGRRSPHGHTSMPPGKRCKHCGHDSSHHVQFIGTDDDWSKHPCWFGVAEPDECAACPGFEAVE